MAKPKARFFCKPSDPLCNPGFDPVKTWVDQGWACATGEDGVHSLSMDQADVETIQGSMPSRKRLAEHEKRREENLAVEDVVIEDPRHQEIEMPLPELMSPRQVFAELKAAPRLPRNAFTRLWWMFWIRRSTENCIMLDFFKEARGRKATFEDMITLTKEGVLI